MPAFLPALVAWPSGLRRWFKAPVSSEAWVRIPPLPFILYLFLTIHLVKILMGKHKRFVFRCLISFQALNRSIVKASQKRHLTG